ncbi:hypothetical protein [Roseinatronobacter bogoriensis]|uniref:Uncharacterized protein n=1 Tax=Roseinatronobacter bogoriensis subsp. barguzinensis TaxID=441209 RepID=A0A2K8K998_9RHOB|nr:hypothetical protein [Rhodobaca]ATX66031.1 hypothetical protein BG454_09515 [Rhodobaca barguzinensis]MBB4207970.1 hypothetical protein [Rhodobaca bogoriensis DSM 18756]TDW38609.1 hypothetical protein LY39_01632 [Rhodobaca barguzinensis]TDY69352.1 hypothetical protein EV660_104235 [Rhodobaca bogoriensis DSM 18756]
MTHAATQPASATTSLPKSLANEPWGIWAAILFVVATLVTAVVTMGVAGLVVVMVPAALAMLVLLCFIVFG